MSTLIDEHTRGRVAINPVGKLKGEDVLERLSGLFADRGAPGFLRSDNGREFTAMSVRKWLTGTMAIKLFL
ncbi:MAG: hypothetical protein AAGA92_11165 [Planctomycetota bacterium]